MGSLLLNCSPFITPILVLALMDEKQRDLIENIYFQYRGLIYKVAIKYFPGKMEETEEVFAESLKRLCCYAQTVERIPCNKLPQYIVSLTANVCIDRIRDIQKKKETLIKQQIMMAEEPISEDNYDLLFDKSYATELINSFDNLLDREKQLLWMRYVECMDFPEIGDILGMKEGAVRTALSRIKKKLNVVAAKGDCHYE